MPRIPDEVIERLKQEVSLERLAEAPRHQAQAPRASRRSIQLLLHGGLDQTLHQVKAVGHLFRPWRSAISSFRITPSRAYLCVTWSRRSQKICRSQTGL
jgi:hypothetical protein